MAQPVSSNLIWAVGLTMIFITPAGSLAAAVLLSFNELHCERHQLLKLANLDESVLVMLYALTTLHRLPWLVLSGIALSPVIVVGWGKHLADSRMAQLCAAGLDVCQQPNIRFALGQVIGLLLLSAVTAAAVVSVIVTCIAVGLWMALRWRSIALALGTGSVLVVLGLAPLMFCFALYLGTSLHSLQHMEGWLHFCTIALTAAVMAVIPYPLIGETSLHAAERWVWFHSMQR